MQKSRNRNSQNPEIETQRVTISKIDDLWNSSYACENWPTNSPVGILKFDINDKNKFCANCNSYEHCRSSSWDFDFFQLGRFHQSSKVFGLWTFSCKPNYLGSHLCSFKHYLFWDFGLRISPSPMHSFLYLFWSCPPSKVSISHALLAFLGFLQTHIRRISWKEILLTLLVFSLLHAHLTELLLIEYSVTLFLLELNTEFP